MLKTPDSLEEGDIREQALRVKEHFLQKGARFGRWNLSTTPHTLDFSIASFDGRCFPIDENYGLEEIVKALRQGQIFNLRS